MTTLNYKLSLYGAFTANDTGGVAITESTIYNPYALANGTSNGNIALGGVTTASVVYIKSDQAISVNLNSNTETAKSILANKPFVSAGTAVTAIFLSNASGNTANVTMFIGGV